MWGIAIECRNRAKVCEGVCEKTVIVIVCVCGQKSTSDESK